MPRAIISDLIMTVNLASGLISKSSGDSWHLHIYPDQYIVSIIYPCDSGGQPNQLVMWEASQINQLPS